jgi:hypothetical protein
VTIDWGQLANVSLSMVSIVVTIIVIPAFRLLMNMRDTLRDMNIKVGATHPPSGILGDIVEMKDRQDEHHEWLLRKGFGRRMNDRFEDGA